jgi:hypothetical protein
MFLAGFIDNINTSEIVTSFSAKAVLSFSFKPFNINFYNSDETMFIVNEKLGFVGQRFIIGLFKTTVI